MDKKAARVEGVAEAASRSLEKPEDGNGAPVVGDLSDASDDNNDAEKDASGEDESAGKREPATVDAEDDADDADE